MATTGASGGEGRGMLAGVVVVELATVLAWPVCCVLLRDMGARVIKVESLGGDTFRSIGVNLTMKKDRLRRGMK